MKQHLLIFELEINGHHPGYLRHLLRYWPDANTHLHFVVSPAFASQHQDVVETSCRAQVTWEPITDVELKLYEASKRSLLRRMWVEWQVYNRYAKKNQADQGLIMYIDRFQLPLALRLFLPCPTSGIFFRPKFHYKQHTERHRPSKEQLNSLREQWVWRSALNHPQLKTLFCLDPSAVESLRVLGDCATIVHLPDPVESYQLAPAAGTLLRHKLAIVPNRKVLLLFGMIDRRKGIYQVLTTLQQLSTSQQEQVTLLIVGKLAQTDHDAVHAEIDRLTQKLAVQIILHEQYVPEEEIQLYFDLADVVLALYQHHVGSSGILIRAAAAGKPVLASDYGLMGELVQQHRLGITVDSTHPPAIAEGIRLLLSKQSYPFDAIAANSFATSNTPTHFVKTLWHHLTNRTN